MKSRPMIFSAPMVRAILAGQKTQTRRVVKVQPPENTAGCIQVWKGENHWDFWGFNGAEIRRVKCSYGVVGDRIWVRESYAALPTTAYAQSDVFQKTDENDSEKSFVYKACFSLCDSGVKWLTPLFMPRAASRIELEITGIRVERLQDISGADAIAEGSFLKRCPCPEMQAKPKHFTDVLFQQHYCHIHGHEYGILWESINGKKYPWSSNPWVWVVEFKRVEVQS